MSDLSDAEKLAAAAAAGVALLGGVLAVIAKNPVRGLYLYIFCSAVLVSPALPVVRDKLSVAEPVLACAAVGLFFGRRFVTGGTPPMTTPQRAALLAGATWVLVVGICAAINFAGGRLVDPVRTAIETATFGLGLFSCALVAWAVNTWDRWLKCLGAWAAGGLVVTAVGLMAMFVYAPGWTKDDFTGRVSSTLRESGQVASYLGPVLPFAALAAERVLKSAWVKVPAQALFLGAFVVMLGTGSRIALLISLCAFCGLVVALLADARRRGTSSAFALALVAAGAVGFGAFVYSVFTDRGAEYVVGQTSPITRPIVMLRQIGEGKRTESHRLEQTFRPLETFDRHPLFGIGPANFGVYYRQHEIHNSYLSVLGETGAAGVIAFAAFVGLSLRCGWVGTVLLRPTAGRALGLAFLFGFGLLLLYQMTALGLRQRPFWFATGLLIALPRAALDLRGRIALAVRRAAGPPAAGS